jgi:hypothetical protein
VPFGRYAPYALDPDHAERLWALSEKLVTPYLAGPTIA